MELKEEIRESRFRKEMSLFGFYNCVKLGGYDIVMVYHVYGCPMLML